MSKEELIDFIKWANTQSNWITIPIEMADNYLKYIKYIQSSPEHETPKVGNNEQAKEVCQSCGNSSKRYDVFFKEWYCSACGDIWETG